MTDWINYDLQQRVEDDCIKKIWDICKISPEHGNAIMDIIGYDTYCRIAIRIENMKEENR